VVPVDCPLVLLSIDVTDKLRVAGRAQMKNLLAVGQHRGWA
jgi:hypothetical protein